MNLYQRLVVRWWWLLLLLFLAAAGGAATLLPRFSVEASTDVLLDEHDPDLGYYEASREEWGTDEYVILCCRRNGGWFTPKAMSELAEIAQGARKSPHVRKVLDITRVPLLRNLPPLFGIPVPITLADPNGVLNPRVDLEKAKQELLEHTQARGALISPDGRDASIVAYLDVPEDSAELAHRRAEVVGDIRALAAHWSPLLDEPVRLSGLPVITVNLLELIRWDLVAFGFASFLVFTLAFAAIYRRFRWVVLPVVTCLLPVVIVLGAMVLTGRKVTVITSNLPALLYILTLPFSVYFIERYRERRALYPDEDPRTTTSTAPRQIWTPCLYSCLTIMAGTASLMTSGIKPVRTFGLMMTVGMALGLAAIMLFLPAAVVPLRGLAARGAGPAAAPRGPLRALSAASLRAPFAVVAVSLAILGVSIWGTTKLRVETKFIDYFWPSSEIYQGLDAIDKRMGGTTPLEIVLRSEKPGYFQTSEGLAALETVGRFFDGVPETGTVRSFRTLVDEGRKSLKMKDESLAARLGSLLPEEVAEFCNKDFTSSRVLVRMRETAPTLNRNRILGKLRAYLKAHQGAELKNVEPRVTGVFLLYANMLNSLIRSQKETFAAVVGAIFLMLVVLFRNPLLAILVLLPQVLPAFVVLGTMGFAGIPLDMVTVMIASMAMGIGVDPAIQYAFRYRAELAAAGGDVPAAIRRSHATIGRAILIAMSVIFAGFAILALSRFVPTVYFGLFTGLAMLMGLLGSLTTLPSAFVLLRYPRLKKG